MSAPTITPQWVSEQQVPVTFGISGRTVRDAATDGLIERRYVGAKPVYRVESITAWLQTLPVEKP